MPLGGSYVATIHILVDGKHENTDEEMALTITKPDGTQVVLGPPDDIANIAPGVYQALITADQPGYYKWRLQVGGIVRTGSFLASRAG